MINNLRSIGALGAVYVACAAVGTAQAACRLTVPTGSRRSTSAAKRSTASTAWATTRSVANSARPARTGSSR